MPDNVDTANTTEAPAAGEERGENESTSDNVKTVDNTEAPAAGEERGDNDKDERTNDKAVTDDGKAERDGDKDSQADKAERAESHSDKDTGAADDSDELDDDELDALDAKVRRRVSKVQRENVNLRSRLKDAEGTRDKVQRENERLTVALNAGLDGDMLKFLTGDTVEELEKNAADLLAVIGYNGRVTPSNGPVERRSNPRRDKFDPASEAAAETDLDTIGARIYRR